MFWPVFLALSILLFIWQERTNPTAKFLPKLIVSVGAGLLATVALYIVVGILKWLFWPIVIVLAIIGIYLAFFAKKK